MYTSTSTLDELSQAWMHAKAAENAANTERLSIEAKIADLVGVKEEGVNTTKTDKFTIKTTGKLSRSVDAAALESGWHTLPKEIQGVFTWKPSVNTKNLRSLESLRDDLIPTLSQFISTKPAKAAISIEPIGA